MIAKLQTPRYWLDHGQFPEPGAAQAVFRFAQLQHADDICDCDLADWLGLTEAECVAFMRDDILPTPSMRIKALWHAPQPQRKGTK